MIFFALKLLAAHLLGDFVFQPDKWVENKREKKYRSSYFYYHLGIHAATLLLLLEFQFKYWIGVTVILVTHYIIDLIKIYLENRRGENSRILFFLDQLAHLGVITLVVGYYFPFTIDLESIYGPETLLLLTAILMVTFVTAILMKQLMSKWILEEDYKTDSLPNAGKYIGILERLLVFTFIVLQQWAAIGWLVTAKSVFRFSDLSRAKDRKLTEYILIGTLLSFGFAILLGMAYLYGKEFLNLNS